MLTSITSSQFTERLIYLMLVDGHYRKYLARLQERLGEALGLTFQQVQKYERGVNRVGASRLFDLSRVLDVPISFFFDDMPDSLTATFGSPATRRAASSSRPSSATPPSRRPTTPSVRWRFRPTT